MRKLKKEDQELGYTWKDKEFAYYIKVLFIDNNGKYDSHTLHCNQEFTKSWPEFAGLINEIVVIIHVSFCFIFFKTSYIKMAY